METIDWFKKLVDDFPDSAPIPLEMYYISIKVDEMEYMKFCMELDRYEEKHGGITRSYSGNENQDYVEIQYRNSYFTVYKKLRREDPFRQRGKLYEIND